MKTASREWPPWWEWELDIRPHCYKRMEDRGFTEVDLRRMMEHASGYRRSHEEGRWLIETCHEGRAWVVVVEPRPEERLAVVSAFGVWEE